MSPSAACWYLGLRSQAVLISPRSQGLWAREGVRATAPIPNWCPLPRPRGDVWHVHFSVVCSTTSSHTKRPSKGDSHRAPRLKNEHRLHIAISPLCAENTGGDFSTPESKHPFTSEQPLPCRYPSRVPSPPPWVLSEHSLFKGERRGTPRDPVPHHEVEEPTQLKASNAQGRVGVA